MKLRYCWMGLTEHCKIKTSVNLKTKQQTQTNMKQGEKN